MTAMSPPAPQKKTGLLINRNFALLWTGQSISNLGDYIFNQLWFSG
jgi:hypothetical protein